MLHLRDGGAAISSTMGAEDSNARLPALDLTCRLCGATVVACTTCGAAFVERGRVQCRRGAGHDHDECARSASGRRFDAERKEGAGTFRPK